MKPLAPQWLALLMLCLYTGGAGGADPRSGSTAPAAKPAVPPPPPPENYRSSRDGAPTREADDFEPEVTIQTRGTEIHEEYRYNGQLYMVKVTPAHGRPYFLIFDERGASRRSDLEPETTVPSWVIKRF
ncbi:MAG: DUF2782 domain-containing protein [Gammaproteobacteria bacterium]